MKKPMSTAEIRDNIRSLMEYDYGVRTEAEEAQGYTSMVARCKFVLDGTFYSIEVSSSNTDVFGERKLLSQLWMVSSQDRRNEIRRTFEAALPGLLDEIEWLKDEVILCRGASRSPHDVKRIAELEAALRIYATIKGPMGDVARKALNKESAT